MKTFGAWMWLLLLLAPAHAGARAFLGVSATNAQPMPSLPEGETRTFASALEVVFVAPGSPGEAAGLEPGDVVLALNGRSFDPAKGDPSIQWRRAIERLEPGTSVTLTMLRRSVVARASRDGEPVPDARALLGDLAAIARDLPPRSSLSLDLARPERIEDLVLTVAAHPLDPPVESSALLMGIDDSRRGTLMRRLAAEHGTSKAEEALGVSLRGVAISDDATRLGLVRGSLAAPGSLPAAVEAFAASPPITAGAAATALGLRGWEDPEPLPRPVSIDELMILIETRLDEAVRLREAALVRLTSEERAFVIAHAADLFAALAEGVYLHADEVAARARRNRRLLGIAGRVETLPLLQAAGRLEAFADPHWLSWAAQHLRSFPSSADDIVARKETAHGDIVIAGTGKHVHRGIDAAFLIDLGGDDVHAHAAGGSRGDQRPVSVTIDLAGDDAYEATGAFAQGSGLLGIGLLIDHSGNDRYIARSGSQGVGMLGVGMLIDQEGDDRYRALHGAQGAAFTGFGLLREDSGRDSYDALSHAQGLGLPRGLGILHDESGDDSYFAKGGAPTGYGEYGVFDSWSQGCGLGLRYLASGGLGILSDGAGSDEYEAGNFAQGGGYFFGLGMLIDRGQSNDHYIASRYGQGWSAHQAVGAFLEEGGDDLYETRHGVIGGLAWDQSVTWFCDVAGDDTYRGGFFSLGASAHDAIAMFEDLDGSDRYEGAQVGQAGPNDYHGGTSVSLFLDLGEGEDFYEQEAPGGSTIRGEFGFAFDVLGLDEIVPASVAGEDGPARPRKRLGR